ncbi:MAG: hypothetical protein OEY86_00930 [Nitrospira sp.]|nr:hypothetical protein [Nitrospira sp.]
MSQMLRAITGYAAELVPAHAVRVLSISGNDSPGGGSAVADEKDEKGEDEQNIVDGQDFEDEDLDDDRPRGKRSEKAERAYDELKSERDKTQARLERQERENAELQARLASLESRQETRQEVSARTNAAIERARLAKEAILAEIKKIPADDPDRSAKVYEALVTRIYQDQDLSAQDISRNMSMEVSQEIRSREERRQAAETEALKELDRQGLRKEDLRLVKMVAREKDESWFRSTPSEEQVSLLVEEAATMLRGSKRSSREFREDKDRHREAMDGVIERGSDRTRARRGRDDDEGEDRDGPGSMLADWKRLRDLQAKNTGLMMRNRDR